MPAYNAEKFISQAIDSVLSQTFVNFELIICNDASSDRTLEIISNNRDPRVIVISNQNNMGAGASRDIAIKKATGNWIALIDADDEWHPQRLEKMLPVACATQNQIVFDNILVCHDVDGKLVSWSSLRNPFAFGSFINKPKKVSLANFLTSRRLLCKIIIPTHLIRKSSIRHSNRKFAEDIDFLMALIAHGGQLTYVPEAYYLYRITPGSATGKVTDNTLMRQCIESNYQKYNWPSDVQSAFSKKINMLRQDETLYAMRAAFKDKNWQLIWKEFWQCPQAIFALPYRIFTRLSYEWHRIKHGGSLR